MNLQQIKGTAEDIGDGGEDITSDSLTKYEKACEDLGVSLKEVKDGILSLRNPMEILNDLAASYNKEAESSIKAANLISAVGGKYRGNQLDALLKQWDKYKKMLSEYNSSEAKGSALEEANKTAQSMEGTLNKLTNDWNGFINSFLDSDLFKSLINDADRLLNMLSDASPGLKVIASTIGNLLDLVTKLVDKIGLLPTVMAGLSLKNVGKSIKHARLCTTTLSVYRL